MRRLLSLFLISLAALASAASDPLWDSSVTALKASSPQKAIEGFHQWIQEHSRLGVESPEAHYNLGLAYWDLKQHGLAVYEVLTGASLRSSPVRLEQDRRTLSALEREIGIKESVPDQTLFQLWLFLNRNVGLWLASLGVWAVVAGALWKWAIRPRPAPWAWGLYAFAAICFLLSTMGAVNRAYLTHPGVLVGSDGIALYRLPQKDASTDGDEKADLKLAELPPGTIVTLGKSQEGFIQITQPVSGWVPSINLRALPY